MAYRLFDHPKTGAILQLILSWVAIGIFISGLASAQENDFKPSKNNMTLRAWLEDFDHFYSIIRENCPFLKAKERTFGYNWLDLRESYRNRLETAKSDYECFGIFHEIVAALQNGHTVIISPNLIEQSARYYYSLNPGIKEFYANWKPLFEEYFRNIYLLEYDVRIAYEKGAYRIVGGTGDWAQRFGKNSEVLEVNGVPVDTAVRLRYNKHPLNYDYKRNKPYVSIIHPRIFGPDAEFKIRTTGGAIRVVHLRTVSNPKLFPPEEEPEPQPRLVTRTWPEKKAAYVWIYNFWGDVDHNPLISFYKKIENYDLLIIDVRGNRGGSYAPWKNNIIAPLAKEPLTAHMYLAYRKGDLVNRRRLESEITEVIPKEYFNNLPPEVKTDDFTIYQYPQTVFPTHESKFAGKIAILADEVTYSAADAFVLFCKETGFGKIFGLPTGGDGIAPSANFCVLPNSKLVIRFTQDLGIDYNGDANEEVKTQPDVYYESSYGNSNELIDYVLETFSSNKKTWETHAPRERLSIAAKQISAAVEIDRLSEKSGIEAAVAEFRRLQNAHKERYVLSMDDFFSLINKYFNSNRSNEAAKLIKIMDINALSYLNYIGYVFLRQKKIEHAIAIFETNVKLYPDDANVYDSLGEAYMMAGQIDLAIKSYEKSLRLNPKNTNAVEQLKKLREKHTDGNKVEDW
jgi:tetratricopeptide (TPR) repeat protein